MGDSGGATGVAFQYLERDRTLTFVEEGANVENGRREVTGRNRLTRHEVVVEGQLFVAGAASDQPRYGRWAGYLIASGLIGELTAPAIGRGAVTNRNSYLPSSAQAAASSSRSKTLPSSRPVLRDEIM